MIWCTLLDYGLRLASHECKIERSAIRHSILDLSRSHKANHRSQTLSTVVLRGSRMSKSPNVSEKLAFFALFQIAAYLVASNVSSNFEESTLNCSIMACSAAVW